MSTPQPLPDAAKLAWLRLWRTEGIGPRGFFKLLHRFGGAEDALAALPEIVHDRTPPTPPIAEITAELAAHRAIGAVLVAHPEPDYPPLLRAIHDPPPLLSLLGRADLARAPCVAIVGSRDASGNGRLLARRIAAELAAAGVTIVSGLARGIDTAAHEGALEAGGATIAVIATGIDIAYPPQNEALMARIASAGLVLTERPFGGEPQARHFPRRNRLIAGLSQAVLVVEAGLRSGSLITAKLALEQGREVLAVPGSPLDERHRGTNQLLKDGAHLVETAEDVLAVLPRHATVVIRKAPHAAPPRPAPEAASDAVREVRARLGPTPLAIDELIRQCHLSPAEVQDALLDLELEGRLERHHGNRVSLVQGWGDLDRGPAVDR